MKTVAPHKLQAILDYIRKGGTVYLTTYTHCTPLNAKTLTRFEKAGYTLIEEDGEGYRIRSGKSWKHVLPGYLKYNA